MLNKPYLTLWDDKILYGNTFPVLYLLRIRTVNIGINEIEFSVKSNITKVLVDRENKDRDPDPDQC